MPSTKFLFTLIGLVLAIFAICKMDLGTNSIENFWTQAGFTATAVPGVCTKQGSTALGGNYMNPNMMGSGKFFQVPNYQGVLSPRAAPVDYGANVRYNMPDRKNMAVPCHPLTFGDMASDSKEKFKIHDNKELSEMNMENYCANCGRGQCGGGCPPSCGKGGYGIGKKVAGGNELPPGYTAGNYQNVYNSLPGTRVSDGGACEQWSNHSDLPQGTMDVTDSAGNTDQFVHFNRIMYANKKSKLRSHGDPIRGDLAITPCQSGWFSVYPNINVDLQAGAMNVMSGANAGNSDLLNLMVKSSGGSISTYAGVDLKDQMDNQQVSMANQSITNLSASLGDVTATAYP